jgi:hypothetical protein
LGLRRIKRAPTATTTITTTTTPAIRAVLIPPDDEEVELVNAVELLEETGGIEELEVVLELGTELEELELELDVEELGADELAVVVLAPTGCKLARSVWLTQSPS